VGSSEGRGWVACTSSGSLAEEGGGGAAPVFDNVRDVRKKTTTQPHRIVKPMRMEMTNVRLLVRMGIRGTVLAEGGTRPVSAAAGRWARPVESGSHAAPVKIPRAII